LESYRADQETSNRHFPFFKETNPFGASAYTAGSARYHDLFQPEKQLPQSKNEYEKDDDPGKQELGCRKPLKNTAEFGWHHSDSPTRKIT
jgi:hypothetical protein